MLMPFNSRYLALETRRGRALDPVAHFHLLNGASIWQLNWLADTSPNGLKWSHSLMTNYRYHLPTCVQISENSDWYHNMNQTIALSNDVSCCRVAHRLAKCFTLH